MRLTRGLTAFSAGKTAEKQNAKRKETTMYIGSLLSGSTLDTKISYSRIGTTIPLEPDMKDGAVIGWKWDRMLLTGVDVTFDFSGRCFIDSVFIKFRQGMAPKSAEILYKENGEYKKAAVHGAFDGTVTETVRVGVHADRIILRLFCTPFSDHVKQTMTNIVIESMDVSGYVKDGVNVFPVPSFYETYSDEKTLLFCMTGASSDGSRDAEFAKALYLEELAEKGIKFGADNQYWYSGAINSVSFKKNETLSDGEYEINYETNICEVSANSRSGFVYAAFALLQLTSDGYLPRVHIKDKPFLEIRGYHMGLPSRKNIPFVKRMIKYLLAPMRYNTLYVEVSAGMRYKKHPEINDMWQLIYKKMNAGEWPMCGHVDMDADGDILEQEEVRDIIECAESFGIEVIPEIQSLSHVQYLTKAHPEIAELSDESKKPKAEDLRLIDIPINEFYPDSYCPSNEKSYELIFDIIDEVVEVFKPKKYVHMGHDEVYTHNMCPLCSKRTPEDVISSDINRIHDYLASKGLKMAIWGDTIGNINWYAAPKAIDMVPKDILLLDFIWYYRPAEDTEDHLLEHGFPVIVGNMYSSHHPRFSSRVRKPGMHGAQFSTWVKLDPKVLSYEGKMYDAIFTGAMMADEKYDEKCFFSFADVIADMIPEMRSKILYGRGDQSPALGGEFTALELPRIPGVPSLVKNDVPKGEIRLMNVEYRLESIAAAAPEQSLLDLPTEISIPASGKADSIVLLLGAGNAVRREAWKIMKKLSDVTVVYADGTNCVTDLEYGYNIYDINERFGNPLGSMYYRHEGYSGTFAIDPAYRGKKSDGGDLTLYSLEIRLPERDRELKEIRIKAAPEAEAPTYVFAATLAKKKK